MDDDKTCPESVLLAAMERAFRGPEYAGTQTRDWQPHMKRVLQCVRENDPMVTELRAELEREGMRLVACGVVAMADTPKSAASARQMSEVYRSASCDDVARRVDECMRLRKDLETAERALDAQTDFRAEIARLRAESAENERLRDALDHIMRVARSARQPTRRLDWIAERARRALDGKPYDQGDMPQYPKTRKDQS